MQQTTINYTLKLNLNLIIYIVNVFKLMLHLYCFHLVVKYKKNIPLIDGMMIFHRPQSFQSKLIF